MKTKPTVMVGYSVFPLEQRKGKSPGCTGATVLRYDKTVGCWLDEDGWAWTITATKRLVDAVRNAPQDTACPLCGRKKFYDVRQRDLHMFNNCPKR